MFIPPEKAVQRPVTEAMYCIPAVPRDQSQS